ncbi:MAG: 4-hydroxy-tetrahydrodipicolinate reductase [Geminicoccaceae bacterium]
MHIGIMGCAGRMGRTNLAEVLDHPRAELAGAVEDQDHPAIGEDLGRLIGREPLGIAVTSDVSALVEASDAVIDFTTPTASLAGTRAAAAVGTAYVLGTTGFSADERGQLKDHSRHCPIVWAANMSQGVNLLMALVEQVAQALDSQFDIEVLEMHHRHKVDAPSGTALAVGEAAAKGRGVSLGGVAVRGRDGHTGERKPGDIGFAVLRGGDTVGDHTVVFAGAGERIELTHRAFDRRIYARGALRAAAWAIGQPAGLYDMSHVLGFDNRSGKT